jgi:hypothetical protein
MNTSQRFFKSILTAISVAVLFQCTDEEMLLTQTDPMQDVTIAATSVSSQATCATCTYVIPSKTFTQVVDGKLLGLKPGAVICLSALNQYGNITFKNLIGTVSNPITITNCGGTATMTATGRPYNMKVETSKYFKITGGSGTSYGIRLNGGHMGLTIQQFSTDFEVNNIEIYNNTFAGIMAKTDPTCDIATTRGHFVMRNVSIRNNYIHDTKGEALYIGHSFYSGMTLSCGVRLPHLIENLKIHNNKITNPGWEAIQVGCALTGAYVYNNTITNYGAMKEPHQNNGIQFSSGTKGICYGNFINGGSGTGINIIGHGDSFIHNNVIVNAGSFGIFADERQGIGAGFKFINNTIVNPKSDGIRTYGDLVPNIILNNIIVNPGTYAGYSYPRTGNDAYVYLLNKKMNVQIANNIFTRDINYAKFISPSTKNFRIASTSPALNKGKDIRVYNIPVDHYLQARLKGTAYDIGASEY